VSQIVTARPELHAGPAGRVDPQVGLGKVGSGRKILLKFDKKFDKFERVGSDRVQFDSHFTLYNTSNKCIAEFSMCMWRREG